MPNNALSVSFDLLQIQGAKRITGKDNKEYVAICIPDSRLNAHKNGKVYLSLDVKSNRDGEDKFQNTHFVAESSTKDERANKIRLPIIGNAKEHVFDGSGSGYKKQSTAANKLPEKPIEDFDDDTSIPF